MMTGASCCFEIFLLQLSTGNIAEHYMICFVINNIYFQEPRLHQLDLRFTRRVRLPRGGMIEPQIDIFNLTNSNSILVMTTRLGPAWRNATGVLAPRVIRLGVAMNF